MKLEAVHIDGWLIFGVTFFGAIATEFSADSVYNYVNPQCVFWIKTFCGALAAGGAALIGYRSKTYANYSAAKAENPTTEKSLAVASVKDSSTPKTQ